MLRRLYPVLAIIITFASSTYCGVLGSDHDLTGAGSRLCMSCHIPHNAQGDKIWAYSPSGAFTGVMDLCYTCHDGSLTSIGALTVFDVTKEQHVMVGSDCSGIGSCHDVHNQNPNGSGNFLVVSDDSNDGTYCDECHDATPFTGAEGLGDHTDVGHHPVNMPARNGIFTCYGCHTPHGARPQNMNYGGLTNPILLESNKTGIVYGQFCIRCHNGGAPAEAIPGTGGVTPFDRLQYAETTIDGSETKHPTMGPAGDDGFPLRGCDLCHDPHNSGSTNQYQLLEDNANSAYCVSCHDGTSGQGVGANSHPASITPQDIFMNSGLNPFLPWANQIDDDGTSGPDWGALASPNMMVCETCHSVHRHGYTGTGSGFFLRYPNSSINEICSACHTDQ